MKRLITGVILALGLTCAVFPLEAQQGGGAFIPSFSYLISGVYTWTQASPFIFEGATDDDYETTLTVTDPTADRTLTLPNATDTLVGKATTDILTNKTLTAPVIATVVNTGTLTLPSATGGLPVALDCGATGSGNQTCAPVAATALTKVYAGTSTLSSNAAIITFPTAFNATTSYQCVANDITTRANPVQMLSTSTSTATITNTTGASDVVNWICVGQ